MSWTFYAMKKSWAKITHLSLLLSQDGGLRKRHFFYITDRKWTCCKRTELSRADKVFAETIMGTPTVHHMTHGAWPVPADSSQKIVAHPQENLFTSKRFSSATQLTEFWTGKKTKNNKIFILFCTKRDNFSQLKTLPAWRLQILNTFHRYSCLCCKLHPSFVFEMYWCHIY